MWIFGLSPDILLVTETSFFMHRSVSEVASKGEGKRSEESREVSKDH